MMPRLEWMPTATEVVKTCEDSVAERISAMVERTLSVTPGFTTIVIVGHGAIVECRWNPDANVIRVESIRFPLRTAIA